MEGLEAWGIIQACSTQLRITPSGKVLGFDLVAIMMAVEAMGCCKQAALSLISSAEPGMLQGIRKLQNGNP